MNACKCILNFNSILNCRISLSRWPSQFHITIPLYPLSSIIFTPHLKVPLTRNLHPQERCKARGLKLEQSKQLHQFLRDLTHEREWIELKMQIATDTNYR